MKLKFTSLLLAMVLVMGLIPAISAAATETEDPPVPLVECGCYQNVSESSRLLYATRPTYSGSLFEASTQRVEDTFAYLDEFYIDKHPEEALLMDTGTESDRDTIKYFAESITSDCSTNTEKAQRVNEWLRRNITYEAYASAYASDTIYRREGNCLSYAVLMQYAMRSLGIPAVVGEGWRCNTTENDVSFFNQPGHAWCFVYLEGQWVLYDPLWLISGTTDRDYIAKWIYLDTTGFICPVSDEDNLPPEAYDRTRIYYCNDRVFMWSSSDPEGSGTFTFQINNMPHTFVSNQCDGDISDGYYLLDSSVDKSQMQKGEVYRYGWMSYGNYSKNYHSSLFYAYPNGTITSGSIMEFQDQKLYCSGTSTFPLLAEEGDFEIIDGKFTLRPGYSGPFLSTHYRDRLVDPEYSLTWESEDPSIATVDENGNITCHSEGRVYIDISLTCTDSNTGNTSLMGEISLLVVISGEERILDLTEKHIHDYSIETIEATCTEGGYSIYTCECGDTYNDDYFDPLGHDYSETITEPTCTDEGYTDFRCTRCEYSYVGDYTDALGHDCGWGLVESTCTAQGYKEYICHRCGDEWIDDYTDPLGHSYQATYVPPTCTAQGYTYHECIRCKDNYKTNYEDIISHSLGDWYFVDTCLERRNCEFCDYYESRESAPAAPVISGGNVASSGKPKLTWNKVDGAVTYQVYRATSKNGTYSRMMTTSGTSYTNTSAKTGKYYYYKVMAISDTGVCSEFSNIIGRTCDLPRPVVKVSNVASSGKIKLSWNAVDGAEKYKVYRSTNKNGTYSLMKTVTGTTYTNTSAKVGKLYYYKVVAVHEKSTANSAYSSVVSRTCDLARPTVKITTNSSGKPKLTWNKVNGAVKYQVYRSTSKNGTYSLMKSVTGTSYTNTSAKSGKTYYYKVKAIYSKSAANSAYSTVKSIKSK